MRHATYLVNRHVLHWKATGQWLQRKWYRRTIVFE